MDDMWQKLRDAAIHTGGPWDSQRMWQAVEARARELLAPPIAGMSVEEIEAEMFIAIREKNRRMEGVLYVQECARVAHRLAQPAAMPGEDVRQNVDTAITIHDKAYRLGFNNGIEAAASECERFARGVIDTFPEQAEASFWRARDIRNLRRPA